jgi:hypothetical protein
LTQKPGAGKKTADRQKVGTQVCIKEQEANLSVREKKKKRAN